MDEGTLQRKYIQYRNLIDSLDVGVYRYMCGLPGRFLELNPAFIKMFGCSTKDEFVGIDLRRLFQNEEDFRTITENIKKHGSIAQEVYLRKKDGSRFIARVTATAIYDGKRTIKFYDGMIQDITAQRYTEKRMQSTMEKLYKTIEGTIRAMAQVVEKIDPYTAGHQRRVAHLAYQIAQDLLLPEDRTRGIYIACLIHDIGKISVPTEMLAKPGSLTDGEYEQIKEHPVFAYNILRTIEFPWPVPHIVLQHHERMDGSGYPYGLYASDIILEARILAVADVAEALGSDRPYRKALNKREIAKVFMRERGKGFDATVVDVCMEIISQKNFIFAGEIMPILHCTVNA